MEQQTARTVYAGLNTIKETLRRIEQEIERLTTLVVAEKGAPNLSDYMAIVGLGASGSSDVSLAHDRYAGEAIADEHLR